ncbi:hypothetical protein [Coleofasciculus sp. H7-2]|uniref:hypothetical protein n=1 Tax=Coleofasciculus sp. H7-2 TaxID=3351545 RepID=UPI0036703D56
MTELIFSKLDIIIENAIALISTKARTDFFCASLSHYIVTFTSCTNKLLYWFEIRERRGAIATTLSPH